MEASATSCSPNNTGSALSWNKNNIIHHNLPQSYLTSNCASSTSSQWVVPWCLAKTKLKLQPEYNKFSMHPQWKAELWHSRLAWGCPEGQRTPWSGCRRGFQPASHRPPWLSTSSSPTRPSGAHIPLEGHTREIGNVVQRVRWRHIK